MIACFLCLLTIAKNFNDVGPFSASLPQDLAISSTMHNLVFLLFAMHEMYDNEQIIN